MKCYKCGKDIGISELYVELADGRIYDMGCFTNSIIAALGAEIKHHGFEDEGMNREVDK